MYVFLVYVKCVYIYQQLYSRGIVSTCTHFTYTFTSSSTVGALLVHVHTLCQQLYSRGIVSTCTHFTYTFAQQLYSKGIVCIYMYTLYIYIYAAALQ